MSATLQDIRLPIGSINRPWRRLFKGAVIAIAGALLLPIQDASAQSPDKIRIGIIGPFSGPFASTGVQFRQGVETFFGLNGNRVGGREVELIYRDTGGTNPAVAKRLAEELIVRDKVSLLGGFYLSPEATAIASVITQTKTPAVLFVAASPAIMKQSPYFVRAGDNIAQAATPPADWAIKKGLKRAYVAVVDYAPGYDVQNAFTTRFKALGGTVIGEDRIPLNTVDYAPFAERIANAKPDIINIFIPSGAPAVAMIKALIAQGINPAKTPIIGAAETDDPDLRLFDDSIIGVYSSLYYALDVPGQANTRFKAAVANKFGPSSIPSYAMVAAYDGMQLMYRMIDSQKGKAFDGTAALKSVEGSSWESPRGVVRIEPDTREMTQDIYIRQVQKVNGTLMNSIVSTFKAVKAPQNQSTN